MDSASLTIVGGGVVGLAVAAACSRRFGPGEVFLLEKNLCCGQEQSGRSSEVIHSGLYYDGLKAELCVRGNALLKEFCRIYNVPFLDTGKIVVAQSAPEEAVLEELLERASVYDVPGLRMLTSREVSNLEPGVRATVGLFSTTSGVIDSGSYLRKLVQQATERGATICLGTEVMNVKSFSDGFKVEVREKKRDGKQYSFFTQYLINAAGLYADDVAGMVNSSLDYHIVPVKGEYAYFRKTSSLGVQRNIYPVPWRFEHESRTYYDLGVHLTPVVGEEIIRVGPLVKPAHNKTDYAPEAEIEQFHEKVWPYFPGLQRGQLSLAHTGILAEEKTHYDFEITPDPLFPRCVHLVGIESPGLTSSLAMGELVQQRYFPK